METVLLVAAGLAVILAAARLVGAAFERVGQPRVIGEIVAGLALGPSLLGALPGDPSAALFPDETRPALKLIGQVGLALFMFVVGLRFDFDALRRTRGSATVVALSSVLVPFALGVGIAPLLHDGGNDLAVFALFVGVAMSITAFPVLARMLAELRLEATRIGTLVLAAAAVNDVIGWSLLAVVLAVASSGAAWSGLVTIGGSLAFVVLLVGFRKQVAVLVARGGLYGALAGLGAAAAITELIDIHFIFGAFLFGAAMPRDELFDRVRERVLPIALPLLPVFFVTPGLQLDVGALGWRELALLALVVAVACLGKVGAAAASARVTGLGARDALAVGVLMNTRGLMELVVLTIGLEAGIIDAQVFTVFVLMAIVTTLATAPLLRLVRPRVAAPA